jgi:hypothetical protein
MLSGTKRCFYKVQDRFSRSASERTSSKHCQTSHSDFQKTFYLCLVDSNFPMTEWGRPIPQTTAPPKEHRANIAERAIRTFKNQFISILCSVDSNFPMTKWDRLVPQTTLTLNLLRSSRIHRSLSACASLFGNYDFNRTPIAPPGTKVVAHVRAEACTAFGHSPEHCRCYKCYFHDTVSKRDVLTVDFFPEKNSVFHVHP